MSYIGHTIRNLGNFSGRANRTEFWYFFLFMIFLNIIVFVVALVLEGQGVATFSEDLRSNKTVFESIVKGFGLITFFANLSLWVRRAHDIGQHGCLGVVYFIIPFLILILGCVGGNPGTNQYGPPPSYPSRP
ncbi:MAG: DUF805 domain-containing protein [Deltaproteobacteria bacterium]|jgi:uncharacterized membrane protein YhaH (DUF805 family)|nr:DUF805 domain-containing protein [Deltaproteobacteria bacterium]